MFWTILITVILTLLAVFFIGLVLSKDEDIAENSRMSWYSNDGEDEE